MRRIQFLFLFCSILLAVLCANPARADDGATDANIKKAESAYGNLEFEGALRLLDKALANQGNSRSQLVRIYLLRGLCLGSLSRYPEAKKSFSMLLALEPSYRLDSDIAPRIREPFDELLRKNMPRLDIQILPPQLAFFGKSTVFFVQVKADSVGMSRNVRLWFRPMGATKYSKINAKIEGAGEIRLSIPAEIWSGQTAGGQKAGGLISWYAEVLGQNESLLWRTGDKLHPLALSVVERKDPVVVGAEQTSWYGRWWVWTLVGGVVAAGVTSAVVLAPSGGSGDLHDFTVGVGVSQ